MRITKTALRILVLEGIFLASAGGCLSKEGGSIATITPESKSSTPTATATAKVTETLTFPTSTTKPPEPTITLTSTPTLTRVEPTKAPAPEVKAVLGVTEGGVNLDAKLAEMQKVPAETRPHGMATILPAFGADRFGMPALPISEVVLDTSRYVPENSELIGIYLASPVDSKPLNATITIFKNSPVAVYLVRSSGLSIDLVKTDRTLTYKDVLELRSSKSRVVLIAADLIGGEPIGNYHVSGPNAVNAQYGLGVWDR